MAQGSIAKERVVLGTSVTWRRRGAEVDVGSEDLLPRGPLSGATSCHDGEVVACHVPFLWRAVQLELEGKERLTVHIVALEAHM